MGTARAHHDAGAVRACEIAELLGEDVAGFEVGRHQDVGAAAATSRRCLFGRAASMLTALSKASGPSRTAAGDLAAIGHLAQGRGIDGRGMRGLTVSAADRIATSGDAHAQRMRQVDSVLHDVALGIEVRARC
jgi:hypothetical protein